jgi:hypothetical protein
LWVLFFSVIGIRLLALPLLWVPTPGIHDEYSYLLMGDTFAHGRLANPTHPLWLSFETFHENWQPTYSSIYPPAQGLILAIGQLLGHPWIGVLLSDALMCAIIFWALQGWMPARWAFLGGVITALKLGFTSYWINSYWGGTAAAIGGALVLGAVGRLCKGAKVRDALLFGLGVAILANSRPYEGLFFCLPAAFWFMYWLAGKTRSKDAFQVRVQRGLLPLTGVLVLTAAFMGYYNWRLTGNVLLMPHALNQQTYHSAPLFLWQHAKPKLHYNNMAFQVFYNGWERASYNTDWLDAKQVTTEKLDRLGITYFWAGALLALPTLSLVFRDRKMRLLWIMLGVSIPAIFAVIWSNAHYTAALTCVFYGLLVQGIRHLRTMRISMFQFGIAFSRAMILLLVLDTGTRLTYRDCDPMQYTCAGNPDRAAVARKLEQLPGKQLVIVRYTRLHSPHVEWVFNGADIDSEKIVWARELGPAQNEKLRAYFKDRQIWLVQPDRGTAIAPYREEALTATR